MAMERTYETEHQVQPSIVSEVCGVSKEQRR
jgi:hypothetical protein